MTQEEAYTYPTETEKEIQRIHDGIWTTLKKYRAKNNTYKTYAEITNRQTLKHLEDLTGEIVKDLTKLLDITKVAGISPRDLPDICNCGEKLNVRHYITSDILIYEGRCPKCGAVYRADGWFGVYRWKQIRE